VSTARAAEETAVAILMIVCCSYIEGYRWDVLALIHDLESLALLHHAETHPLATV
jgi:hypothetical protein